MSKKIKIGLIMGGRSGEHEVSLVSAWNIFNGLDNKKYEIHLIGIDKDGNWLYGKDESFWVGREKIEETKINSKSKKVAAINKNRKAIIIDISSGEKITDIDIFFPIIHGTFGEDGTLQGYLEMLNCAYVGPGVLSSSVCMDKDVTKRLLNDAGVLNANGYVLKSQKIDSFDIDEIVRDLDFPIFVKPANMGSSVGVSKAKNKKDLMISIKKAFEYDKKVIVEEAIIGREIECSVIGNEKPVVSVPGEIKLSSDFYTYEAKYISEDAAQPIPKAELSQKQKKQIQETAMYVYDTLGCEGMARVDFFLTKKGKLYVNEVNTLPGFTNISMFPKMFEESGIKYSDLLDKIIGFAIERGEKQDKLKRDF